MTNTEFKKLVGNRIFGVTFIKKDGTPRTYKARVDVSKYTKGGDNPVEHKPNLVTIFEMDKKQYRTLNLESVTDIKLQGVF